MWSGWEEGQEELRSASKPSLTWVPIPHPYMHAPAWHTSLHSTPQQSGGDLVFWGTPNGLIPWSLLQAQDSGDFGLSQVLDTPENTGTCTKLHTSSEAHGLLTSTLPSSPQDSHGTEHFIPKTRSQRPKALLSQETGTHILEHPHTQHCARLLRGLGEPVSLQSPLASWQHICLEFSIIGPAAIHGSEPGSSSTGSR